MISLFSEDWRRRRTERQAAAWVSRILDDRDRYAEGLRHWIGTDKQRAEIYNFTYRRIRAAEAPAERLFGTMRERANWRPLPGRRGTGGQLGLAVAFGLILGGTGLALTLGLLDGALRRPASDAASDAPLIIATKVGEIRPVQLSDGSQIILDTDSVLRVSISKQSRVVHLDRGRARFQVADDGGMPFVVTAGEGVITSRATMFDVAVYRTLKVSLLSGPGLDFRYPVKASSRPRPVLRLTAGHQFSYNPSMSEYPSAARQTRASDAQWVDGMRTFDDVPVSDIIEETNRYSKTKIELADPSLGDREAFLDLDLRNTSDVAHNLAPFLGLSIDTSRPGVIVLTPAR